MIRSRRTSGFTLLELAIVLVVLSLLLSGVMAALTQNIRRVKQADLQAKFEAVEQKLLLFRQVNGRLPCPADGTYAITAPNYGKESINSGACTTGSTYDGNGNRTAAGAGPTVNFYTNLAGFERVGGVVPVRTLGLPDDAMFDPWGGAFLYVVDSRITQPSAFTTFKVNDTQIGSIIIVDPLNVWRTGKAVALLLSYGANGHGAYQLGGVRKSSGSNNPKELNNCHCNNNAVATAFDPTFVQRAPYTEVANDPTQSFDDITRYYMRSSFLNAGDILP